MWRRKKRRRKNNPKNSGHFVPLQRPRAAHALRADQKIKISVYCGHSNAAEAANSLGSDQFAYKRQCIIKHNNAEESLNSPNFIKIMLLLVVGFPNLFLFDIVPMSVCTVCTVHTQYTMGRKYNCTAEYPCTVNT